MKLLATVALVILLTIGDAVAGQDDPRLGPLFERLVSATEPVEAAKVESEIWQAWLKLPDTRIAARMERGITAMNDGDLNEALEMFDEITRRLPNFAEGWNKRATVHYLMREFDASVRDIVKTLNLEPRHFGALSGLGLINEAIGQPVAAIRAYEKALSIHPHMQDARRSIRRLKRLLRGKET